MLTGYFIHSLMLFFMFFFMLMLFTFWYIFRKANIGCSFLCVMLLSEALVKSLVIIKSLSSCLFIKDFIFPSIVKLSLAEYEILGWKFCSLRMLNIGPHSLLACRVSAERSAVSLIGFPLWVAWPFSLVALSIFSFVSTLINLKIMCLGVALLEEYLCGGFCITWGWILSCFARLGNFS